VATVFVVVAPPFHHETEEVTRTVSVSSVPPEETMSLEASLYTGEIMMLLSKEPRVRSVVVAHIPRAKERP
jgi:hypothetical protein